MGAFTVLWSSRSHGETVAGNGAITQIPNGAGSASPGKTPGDSSASPEEQSSSAKAGGAAAAGGRTAAESQELSQQGGDAAADVADGITKGASSGTPNVQGGRSNVVLAAHGDIRGGGLKEVLARASFTCILGEEGCSDGILVRLRHGLQQGQGSQNRPRRKLQSLRAR